ncbi:Eco57I restriction-modification methylase domain-containing protein [Mariniluteicoccus endophyticus]
METPSRKNAGAHYTPRALAEEVVRHALEPLIYQPGPHQTADRALWQLKSPEEILGLKVADIACGSGAFLVAAARYLADKLVEAWAESGRGIGTPEQQRLDALRLVVAKCLYGVDINEMAIEMCKLSLWLVSLDPKKPFSFVDDKLLVGNSLLGITHLAQLRALHIDPGRAPDRHLFDQTASGYESVVDIDGSVRKAIRIRQDLDSTIDNDDPMRSRAAKEDQWRRYNREIAKLRDVADGVVAAGLRLGGKPGTALDNAYAALRMAVNDAYDPEGAGDRTALDQILADGLTPGVTTDYERWQCLHWPIAFADVFTDGGFDAVVGNPPFLGGKKISPAMGDTFRLWITNVLAGRSGNGDLVAYFFLRARDILKPTGTLGLIATNTVAQGDTREVGLDQLVASGFTITRAIQSRSWPAASANLEYAAVWGNFGDVSAGSERIADDLPVGSISTLLEAEGRILGQPIRLPENVGLAFQGCIVLGKGFVLGPEEATAWLAENPRNAEVLFPYLNGEDLNSRPDASASRWVIDFNEMPEADARSYRLPWRHAREHVYPERSTKDVRKYPRMVNEWWKFWNARPALRRAVADLDEVLVIARVSKTVMPLRVTTGQVLSEATVVFATDSYAQQAVLSSSLHQIWGITYGSTLETRVRYTPSDVFETFPRPQETPEVEAIGHTLDTQRREIMLRRELGLTKLYNLVNDEEVSDGFDPDVARLRQIHVELDQAVMAAYGWDDVPLDHGFHTYRQMTRWTVSPAARVEILDRLLEENHRRAAAQGDAPVPTPDDEDEE